MHYPFWVATKSMFAVDTLADEEGKTGLDWYWARAKNTYIFRPNEACLLEHLEGEIRMGIRKKERVVEKQRKEIAANYKSFERLVNKNDSPHDINYMARQISIKEIGMRRNLTILENYLVARQEMEEICSRKTEQDLMAGLTSIYSNFIRRAQQHQGNRKVIQYEINKDAIEDMHDVYHDAWRSGAEFQNEGNDTNALVCKMIERKGLNMPDVPVFMDKVASKKPVEKKPELLGVPEESKVEYDQLMARYQNLNT